MENILADALLLCIKKDSVRLFDKIDGEGKYGVRFGRFPLLSALYLCNAKRIIKSHFNRLVSARTFTDIGASAYLDGVFRAKAGKAMRHYLGGQIVSAPDMLALLGKYHTLKKVYPKFAAAGFNLKKLQTVVQTDIGVAPQVENGKIKLPFRPLTPMQKRKMKCVFAVCALCVVAVCTLIVGLAFGVGFGTKAVPYIIKSQQALEGKKGYAKLVKDIEVTKPCNNIKLHLDGDGHTALLKSSLAKQVSGDIKNLCVIYDGTAYPVTEENSGNICGIKVTCTNLAMDKQCEYQGMIANQNDGKINSCVIDVNVVIGGEGSTDCYFGLVAGKNNGTVLGTVAKGSVSAAFADIGGIVGYNGEGGVIENCNSTANITVSCTSDGWNPNVGGIAVGNDGSIANCENSGNIEIDFVSTAEENTMLYAQGAGIAVSSCGSIGNCKNSGSVTVQSANGYATASGIVCLNTYRIRQETLEGGYTQSKTICGSVENCVCEADVTAMGNCSSFSAGIVCENNSGCLVDGCSATCKVKGKGSDSEEVFSYLSGIVAFNAGGIRDSVARVDLDVQGNFMFGAVVGTSLLYSSFFDGYYLDMADNSYLVSDQSVYGVGSVFYSKDRRQVIVPAEYLSGALANIFDFECERLTSAE